MKFKESSLTQHFLRECFTYDDISGHLVWNTRPCKHFSSIANRDRFNTQYAGKKAGYFNKRTDSKQDGFGYWRVRISVNGCTGHFKMHRLIWLYHNGFLPKVVDHQDNDTNNNRLENLREGTVAENSRNIKTPVNNVTGYKGVSLSSDPKRRRKPYRASIEFDGYIFGLGNYSCKHQAALSYNRAAELLFKSFSNLNVVPEEYTFKPIGKFHTETYYEIEAGTFNWNSKTRRKI